MRLPRLLCSVLLCAASLSVTASLASASHVPPAVPLTVSPNHSHEKFTPTVFPAADYSFYNFSFADLTNCTFAAGSNLSSADFTGATMVNTTLMGCNLDNARFWGANLTNSALPCMGGADFRGAVLTGAIGGGTGCSGCTLLGPNRTDNCTVSAGLSLCLAPVAFRGVVSGVVFFDTNGNGQLDFGEAGVPGAAVGITAGAVPSSSSTDSRGAYLAYSPNAVVGTVSVVLPAGLIFTGPPSLNFNLGVCRNGQGLNFPVLDPVTPAIRSTFGRVKALYR